MTSNLLSKPARRPKVKKPETSVIYATVARVERIRPRVQRITFVSEEFAGFISTFPDQFITYLFPTGDRKKPAISREFTWDDWFAIPEPERPHSCNYTVRAYRPESNEIDVDMILHGDTSIGSKWALDAEPGDAMAIWGPRTAYDPPPNVSWMLLAGDDTAVPGACAIAESLPASVSLRVILEVENEIDVQPIIARGPIEVTWHYRNGTPHRESTLLIDAVRATEMPEGVHYAWGGGEMRTMTALGRHLRRERGFRVSDVSMTGYWYDEPH